MQQDLSFNTRLRGNNSAIELERGAENVYLNNTFRNKTDYKCE